MRVAVIPARGGRKRIPRKNIRLFHGKPIIAWSIEILQRSKSVDKIIVSTDDQEVASIASTYGAEIPFMRPESISDDYSTTVDVMKHAAQWLSENYQKSSITEICCMYATAPFALESDLNAGLKILIDEGLDYVFTATDYVFPIERSLYFDRQGLIRPRFPKKINMRSQDLKEAYHDAAQFYWGSMNAWVKGLPIFSSKSSPLILSRSHVQDIDTLEDWNRAEILFSIMNKGNC
jgi:pseudaminic acid cytidylyltransferase